MSMDSILYLANICKFSYKGQYNEGYDFSQAKIVEVSSSKMVIQKHASALVVCVTGTDSVDDWFLDADMAMIDLVVDDVHMGKVHRGFLTYIMRLWPSIMQEIDGFLQTSRDAIQGSKSLEVVSADDCDISMCHIGDRNAKIRNSLDDMRSFRILIGRNKVFKVQKFRTSLLETTNKSLPVVIFTGHSLGSCCTIAALMTILHYKNRIKVRCISFASPKIGDREWVASYTKHIGRNFRVVHNHDIVSMLPLGNGYVHVNDEVRLGSNGRYLLRHRHLLWLLGNSLFCRLFNKCSGGIDERLLNDHRIDKYIDAINEAIETGKKVNPALGMALSVGSVDRHYTHDPGD